MPKIHTVQKGEHLPAIAIQYGFGDWTKIYNAPANADFRKRRPDPELICAGDQINIPDKKTKTFSLQARTRYKFKLVLPAIKVHIVFKDSGGASLKGLPYELNFGGKSISGNLDDEGKIEQEVPGSTKEAEILIFQNEKKQKILSKMKLKIGDLDPWDEVTGIQARLNNLGYACGEENGDAGLLTATALSSFQLANGLEATGKADAATLGKLKEIYGC